MIKIGECGNPAVAQTSKPEFRFIQHTLYLLSTETRCSISFWLQALELFSLLTVRVALSQAEANLLRELATHSLQDNEELQDDTGSVYSYGI